MTTTPASLSFDGLTCPCCSYDVRGLPRAVCPECGQAFDPQATPRVRPVRPIVGCFAAVFALASATYVVHESYGWLSMYIDNIGGWCGTPALAASHALSRVVPAMLAMPAAAAGVSFWAKCAFAVTCTATLAGTAGWFLCYALMRMC